MTNESPSRAPLSSIPSDQLRLLLRVARLYHEQGVRQPAIAAQLNLSQARVSRLLKLATQVGIVRTIVVPPVGTNTEIEQALEDKYGIGEVVVVDVGTDDPGSLLSSLGGAAAAYLTTALRNGEHVGLSSWSETLIAAVAAMRPASVPRLSSVVQIIGGLGAPGAQPQATRLVGRLAELSGAAPIYLPAPGLLGSKLTRQALLEDPSITAAQRSWDGLDTVIVGIGSIDPSPLLQESGNAVPPAELEQLRSHDAVGDVCLRFFDENGSGVRSDLDDRVLGITEEQLRAVPRRVGVAGGLRKADAIRAAVRGGWVNVLITDAAVADRLLAD